MKLKNKIFAGSLLLLVAIGGVSCKKYLDVNENPLSSLKVEPKLLFGYAVTAWDVSKNSGDNYIALGFIGQTFSSGADFSGNWGSSNLYTVNSTALGNNWKTYYSNTGFNLVTAIKLAEAKNDFNTVAQCKIVLAQVMYEATTLYGDVPFSQAFQIEAFPYPKYDSQKDVLEGIITMLDQAVAQIDVNSTLKISDYDIFYNGNLDKWKKLANSIKLKTLMVMVDKDPSKAAAVGALVSNPTSLISSAADNFRVLYTETTNNENPKYRLFLGEDPLTYASKVVTDIMVPKKDPRLSRYFDKPAGETEFIGVGANVDADKHTSTLGNYLLRKTAPSLIFSYQEMLFLQAEAYARGLGVTKNLTTAQELYKKAIIAAMNFYEVPPADITTYIDNNLVDLTKAADPVKEIHLEQWIDLVDRPADAFVQWRRSGSDGNEVPKLTLPKDATPGPLFRRFVLSPEEIAGNPNIPTPTPVHTDKMWFDL
ncbi:SusD/RagB family nutrient-binding outer membrane lipoprotein [Pedobacter steynii]|uniref:Starch-binding associating with outer membrane n=1 Tax=Pedobacter steynii TaxID=430522 RepID=A0A1D7QD26_9SPHI|nr:SusD/RagB family nutrient-binding outer membrane lipoprotein [Pedobacter steynii]AOM76545.1 hypothetical protein BFS30_04870 [Pedobacter steynii]